MSQPSISEARSRKRDKAPIIIRGFGTGRDGKAGKCHGLLADVTQAGLWAN